MPTMKKLLEMLREQAMQNGREAPTEQHIKAAKLLMEGKTVHAALIEAGFSEGTANKGRKAISGPIIDAMIGLGFQFEAVGEALRSDPQRMEHTVLGFLYQAMRDRNSKGVNAAKLMGMHKAVDMFTQQQGQNIVVIQAPADWQPLEPGKEPVRDAPKALPPAEADLPEYE